MARILLKLRASRISNGPRNSNHAVDCGRKSSHAVRLPAFRSISFCHLIVILRPLPLVSLLRRARFRRLGARNRSQPGALRVPPVLSPKPGAPDDTHPVPRRPGSPSDVPCVSPSAPVLLLSPLVGSVHAFAVRGTCL